MTEQIQEVVVEKREVIGKASGKKGPVGNIPATVYGGGAEPISIYVDSAKVIEILRSEKGMNTLLLFSLKGTKRRRHVMIKDFQINPVTNKLNPAFGMWSGKNGPFTMRLGARLSF